MIGVLYTPSISLQIFWGNIRFPNPIFHDTILLGISTSHLPVTFSYFYTMRGGVICVFLHACEKSIHGISPYDI